MRLLAFRDYISFTSIEIAPTAMRRIHLSLLAIALAAAPWSYGQAAGSFQTKAAFSNEVSDNYVSLPSSLSVPHTTLPANDFGCGKGRVRDFQTHGCRGPADIR
jgi:hypothetical protein